MAAPVNDPARSIPILPSPDLLKFGCAPEEV